MNRPLFRSARSRAKSTDRGLTSGALIWLSVVLIVALGNLSFFRQVWATYAGTPISVWALASLPLTLAGATALLLGVFAVGPLLRPVLTLAFVASAASAYFMDAYGVVISDEMLQNVEQTQSAEVFDLLTPGLALYLGLGLGAVALIWRLPLLERRWHRGLIARLGLVASAFALVAGLGWGFSGFYASFIREHKALRGYANPTYPVYSLVKYAKARWNAGAPKQVAVLGADARIQRAAGDERPRLVILVVGETARTDRLSLNGYGRETNPRLMREDVTSFANFRACGTSTAISVPCMFSFLGRKDFEVGKALRQENVLDVLQRAGVGVLWLDNNSDSKGVATRVEYRNFRIPENNPECDSECRDTGLLAPLQALFDAEPARDRVIVLHQMGNHGPAYYKRYPPAFERFKPTCQSKELAQCSLEEIGNAYDNAILYTDHFLAEAIALLKRNDARYATALLYLSDHGESLGENGVFLHGLPYAVAPEAQIRVPAVFWFGQQMDRIDRSRLAALRDGDFSHDHLPHTLLGLFEVRTSVYRSELDLLRAAR